ncbi:/ / DNA polymerase III PolC / 79553:81484 Reverse [Candidatus Hepatoplasma crinochetorum]|uniref:/ / DNA polymerase III PolC / 79553:81484 Reverse n=1 Tax=Candidatus Hepatoplasma crinochetorum TaxID=295596 RepID=A0A0G7ZNB5_9MOLU|nr:/ / DNA polymerase III PolC / 79553:81484 Reverse [Candidatus Hepatoplasma crinochetorum]
MGFKKDIFDDENKSNYKSKELVSQINFIVEKVKKKQKNFKYNEPIIINFTGKKGSGKTYYLNYLLSKLNVKKSKIKKIDCKSFEQRRFQYPAFERDIFGYRGKLVSFLSEIRNLYYLIALIWISFSFILIILDQSESMTALWLFISAIFAIFVLPIIPLFFNKKKVYIFDEINRMSEEGKDVEIAVYRFISEFKEKSKQSKFSKWFLNLINIDYKKIIIIETDSEDKLFNEDLKYIDYVLNIERKEIENIKVIRNELSKNAIEKDEFEAAKKDLSDQIISYYIEKNNFNLRISILELEKIIKFYLQYNKLSTKETKLSLDTIIVIYNIYKNENDWKLFEKIFNHFNKNKILDTKELNEIIYKIKNKSKIKILFEKLLKDNFIISINNVFKEELKPIIENISKLYIRENIFKDYKLENEKNILNLIKTLNIKIKNEELTFMVLVEDLLKNSIDYQNKFFEFILKNKNPYILNLRSFIFGEINDPIINWKYQILNGNFKEIIIDKMPYFKELFVGVQKNYFKPLSDYISKNNKTKLINIPYFYQPIFQSKDFSNENKIKYIDKNFDLILDKYIISNNYSYQNYLLFDEILEIGNIEEKDLKELILKIDDNEKYKNTFIKLSKSKINKKIDLSSLTLFQFANDKNLEIRKIKHNKI